MLTANVCLNVHELCEVLVLAMHLLKVLLVASLGPANEMKNYSRTCFVYVAVFLGSLHALCHDKYLHGVGEKLLCDEVVFETQWRIGDGVLVEYQTQIEPATESDLSIIYHELVLLAGARQVHMIRRLSVHDTSLLL